jgi:hypothetical protein
LAKKERELSLCLLPTVAFGSEIVVFETVEVYYTALVGSQFLLKTQVMAIT